MSSEKTPTTGNSKKSEEYSQKSEKAFGGKSENEPIVATEPLFAKPVQRFHHTMSEYFVAVEDNERGTVALMPIGWVGEPSLIIAKIRLEDLKGLVNQL